MVIFAKLLKRPSPSQQLASFGHGWIELSNGQRWQPAPGVKPTVQARRRSAFSRLFELVGGKRGR